MRRKTVSLAKWSQTLRPYQETAVKKALTAAPKSMTLLSSPTGTGKGTMQLALLKRLRKSGVRAWIVTPSIEVLRGYLERCGASERLLDGGSSKLARLGRKIFVTTPVRLRNALRGRIVRKNGKRVKVTTRPPEVLIIDEAHHATDHTIAGGGLRELCPEAKFIGFTATPFRSTPEESGDLLTTWGKVHFVLSIPDAIEQNAWALPTWRVEPLINDDNCGIVAGDIDADEATITAASPLADLIASLDLNTPTCVTVSTTRAAKEVTTELQKNGVDARIVLSTTPTAERAEAYKVVKSGGRAVLVSVRVLGEGVDLPWLRRWVDASPTLSPVAFLQKLGRITRPHASGQPEYVGTCRNLERHGYLLQGILPRTVVKEVQEKFGGGSRRGARAGMLKGVGKLKPIELPLTGGIKGTLWSLWHPSVNGGSGYERCVLLDPTNDRVISAVRTIDPTKEGKDKWGPWTREETPGKLSGFKSRGMAGKISETQAKWWKRESENRGLDGSVVPTRAQFRALPVLKDVRASMRPDGKTLRPEVEERARKVRQASSGVEQDLPLFAQPKKALRVEDLSHDVMSHAEKVLNDLLGN